MAVALEIGIRDLLTEFLANAFVLLGARQTAGAVSAGALESVLDHLDDFLVFIQPNSHMLHILSKTII